MEIAVISDQHFGFDWGGERQEDSFRNCREAFERSKDADVVLIPGDLFDKKVPRQEVMGRAIELFEILACQDTDLEIGEESDKEVRCRGKPVVAIHGTHERRSEDFLNPVQLLEKAGYLVHLHNEKVVYERDGEKLAIHGMSGVPERYAPQVLKRFDPHPVEDAFNVLMLHQSVENFVYTDSDRSVLKLEHFPKRFDYIIDGHIHWRNLDMKDKEPPFVIPGSTITTQINRTEAKIPKGFLTIDTESGDLEFHELENTRPVFHREIDVSGMSGSEIRDRFREEMEEVVEGNERKPLVRINLEGETDAEVSLSELRKEYGDRAVLKLSKDLKSSKETVDVDHSKETALDKGKEILKDKMSSPEVEQLFEILSEGNTDQAVKKLEEMDVEDLKGTGESEEEEEKEKKEKTVEEEPGDVGSGIEDGELEGEESLERFVERDRG